MTTGWRLTPHAEDALHGIALWTIERFGVRQAAAYEEDLIACCAGIAAGTIRTQDCSGLAAGAAELRYARAGAHFVIFTTIRGEVTVFDFRLGRSDLPMRLRRLAQRIR